MDEKNILPIKVEDFKAYRLNGMKTDFVHMAAALMCDGLTYEDLEVLIRKAQ